MKKVAAKSVQKAAGAVKKTVSKASAAVKKAVTKKVETTKPETKKVSVAKSKSPSQSDIHRRIQEKAYDLYLSRGCANGGHESDWHEAERIVTSEIKARS